MSPPDTGFPRDPEAKKRMLPSVTDVVRELAKVVSADPAVLFKAARGVVAEELAKVKQGLESASLDVLVRRAWLQLERDGSAKPVSGPAPPFTPVFPARRPASREARKTAPPSPDEPFENAPTRAELGWEKEIPVQLEDAPFQATVVPIPYEEFRPLEISAPAEASSRPAPERKPTPAPSPQPELELEQDLAAPPAVPEPPPEQATTSPTAVFAPADPLAHLLEPDTPEAVPPLLAPPPFVPTAPAETPGVSLSAGDERPEPEMEEFHFKAAEGPAPVPARSSRKGWLVAVALVLAIGVGLAWAVREYVFRNEIVKPVAPAAEKRPYVAPAASAAPVPAATPAPAPAARPEPPAAKAAPARAKQAAAGPPPGAAVPRGRAALLLTPDWAGKPVVYVIHFSSHKDREGAAKAARKLGAALGAPARAVEVDLGGKGVWYRVVLGEFADVDAARAFRADLEAKQTPGMGFVYEMRGR